MYCAQIYFMTRPTQDFSRLSDSIEDKIIPKVEAEIIKAPGEPPLESVQLSALDDLKAIEDEIIKEVDGWSDLKKAVCYSYLHHCGTDLTSARNTINKARKD